MDTIPAAQALLGVATETIPARAVHYTERGVLVRVEDGRAAWMARSDYLDGAVRKVWFECCAEPDLTLLPVEVVKTGEKGSVLVQAADGRRAWIGHAFLEGAKGAKGVTQKIFEENAKKFEQKVASLRAQREELHAQGALLIELGKVKTSESGKGIALRASYTNTRKLGPDGLPKAGTMQVWLPASQVADEDGKCLAPLWLLRKKAAELAGKILENRALRGGAGELVIAGQRFKYSAAGLES